MAAGGGEYIQEEKLASYTYTCYLLFLDNCQKIQCHLSDFPKLETSFLNNKGFK